MMTLAIPFYSQAPLFERAFRSAFEQTRTDWHMVVVDNSPSEQESQWVRDCIHRVQDPRVRWVRETRRLSIGQNWNRCLEEAQTEWVTLFHADDELEPTYVEKMSTWIQEHREVPALFCGAHFIGPAPASLEASSPSILTFPDFYKQFLIPDYTSFLTLEGNDGISSLIRGQYVICPTFCFHKNKIRERGGFSPHWKMVVDFDLFSRLLFEGEKIIGFPHEKLYRYRRHPGSATSKYTKDLSRFLEEKEIYLWVAEEARKRNWSDLEKLARSQTVITRHLFFCFIKAWMGRDWPLSRLYWEELWKKRKC